MAKTLSKKSRQSVAETKKRVLEATHQEERSPSFAGRGEDGGRNRHKL